MTEKKVIQKTYINTSKENIFTENGRCMPGQTVKLTATQAKQYKGLSEEK